MAMCCLLMHGAQAFAMAPGEGVSLEASMVPGPEDRWIVDVYFLVRGPSSRVLSVYADHVTYSGPGGFYQSTAYPFWKPGVQQPSSWLDSYVTVGTNPNGNGNLAPGALWTFAFANYDDIGEATDFSYIQNKDGTDTVWAVAPLNTTWGYALPGNPRVLLARLVVTHPRICDLLDIDMTVYWKTSPTAGMTSYHYNYTGPLLLATGCGLSCTPCCELSADGGRFCEDAECCSIVCSIDPSCCSTAWDLECVETALAECTACGGGSACMGDLDGSGAVDGADLGLLLDGWGQAGKGDLDGDGTVGGLDLGALLTGWGNCP